MIAHPGMVPALGLCFDAPVPAFDDDGCTFVKQWQGVVYRNENQKWDDAVGEVRDYFYKMHELQVGEY